jgi:hypothetical protein
MRVSGDVPMAFPALQEAVGRLFVENPIDVSAAAFLAVAVKAAIFREGKGWKQYADDEYRNKTGQHRTIHDYIVAKNVRLSR